MGCFAFILFLDIVVHEPHIGKKFCAPFNFLKMIRPVFKIEFQQQLPKPIRQLRGHARDHLVPFEARIIEAAIAHIGRIQRGKLKNGLPQPHAVHVDEVELPIAVHHDVLGMAVPMHQMIVIRHGLQHGLQLLCAIGGKIFPDPPQPSQHPIPARLTDGTAARSIRRNLMDAFQKLHHHSRIFLDAIRPVVDQRRQCLCLQHLVHRAKAVPQTHDIIGNRRGDAQHEHRLCRLQFRPYLFQREIFPVGFDHRIAVHAIDLPIGALGQLRASIHREPPHHLFRRHHLGESRHLEDFIGFRRHIHKGNALHALGKYQKDPEAHAGNISQPDQIQRKRLFRVKPPQFVNLRLHRLCIGSIHFPRQIDDLSLRAAIRIRNALILRILPGDQRLIIAPERLISHRVRMGVGQTAHTLIVFLPFPVLRQSKPLPHQRIGREQPRHALAAVCKEMPCDICVKLDKAGCFPRIGKLAVKALPKSLTEPREPFVILCRLAHARLPRQLPDPCPQIRRGCKAVLPHLIGKWQRILDIFGNFLPICFY